ncbi:MAG: metal ABC transporter substrate-binding protein [Deltaproteobacteria bacterium]|nr:metal ABC transporter substrate-binding protein [Deltaproteobacteria bacterium]
MRSTLPFLLSLTFALLPAVGHAADEDGKPQILATLPTVGALLREVGGDAIEVSVLARGDEDPHFVQATPRLMRQARDADALFEVGMRLELWVDNVTGGAGNPRLQRGMPGRVVLSDGVPPLEVPTRIDAAQGDIHPQGNPHIWLDPVRAKLMARNAAAGLQKLFPEQAALFAANLADFEGRLDRAFYGEALLKTVGARKLDRAVLSGRLHDLLDREFKGKPLRALAGGWLKQAEPLAGRDLVEFHKVWAYFASAFGFTLVGTVEAYPGIRPGPGHLEKVVALMKAKSVPLILVDNFYLEDLPRHVAGKAGAGFVMLPDQVGGEKDLETYFQLIDRILSHILGALEAGKAANTP